MPLALGMPGFLRFCWTSDKARETWAPRFKRVVSAWAEIEWASPKFGLRNCALATVSAEHFQEVKKRWVYHGLQWLRLDSELGQAPSSNAVVPGMPLELSPLQFALGNAQDSARLNEMRRANNSDGVGELLGYPRCCRASFGQRCVSQGSIDPTWEMALEGLSVSNPEQILIEKPMVTNVLWRWVGIRAVPHLPCRFDCTHSVSFSHRFLAVGSELGLHDETRWLQEILSWPLEWSALHGIAEIKTPLLKMCTKTDVNITKRIVRCCGDNYPEEGARGVKFPYRTPTQEMLTTSPGFQRGLKQIALPGS
jgi:hypothetical protein